MTRVRIKIIIAICLVILAIVGILQNTGTVVSKFLFFTVAMPQAVLLLITLLIGIAVGATFALSKTIWTDKAAKKPKSEGA